MADDAAPKVLTKEMIDKLKIQLDGMEGATIAADGPIVHRPGEDAAWYIAYKTSSIAGLGLEPGGNAAFDDAK